LKFIEVPLELLQELRALQDTRKRLEDADRIRRERMAEENRQYRLKELQERKDALLGTIVDVTRDDSALILVYADGRRVEVTDGGGGYDYEPDLVNVSVQSSTGV
jgi:hypothetical protein